MRFVLIVVGAFLFCGAMRSSGQAQSSTAPPKSPSSAAGNIENGKRLFANDGCFECHGREGQGASTGPRIALSPRPLASFIGYIRQPKGEMPPYTEKVISDAEAADILVFLKSLPPPVKPENIPLLK
jgi:mono/diheme cytochrome c family protein